MSDYYKIILPHEQEARYKHGMIGDKKAEKELVKLQNPIQNEEFKLSDTYTECASCGDLFCIGDNLIESEQPMAIRGKANVIFKEKDDGFELHLLEADHDICCSEKCLTALSIAD